MDVAKMLLECWVEASKDDEASGSSIQGQQPHWHKEVIDITVWLLCQLVCECTGKRASPSHTRADGIHDNLCDSAFRRQVCDE